METSGIFGTSNLSTSEVTNNWNGIKSETTLSLDAAQKNIMNKDDFLKLLLAQMQHQDPLNPLENTEFLGQLSQFTELEQMYNLNTQMENLSQANQTIRDYLAAGFIGQTAKIEGSEIYLTDQEGVNFDYELMDLADQVTINIYDQNSNLVKTIDKGHQDSGPYSIFWDGLNEEGQYCGDGKYTFEVTATEGEESVWVKTYMIGQVREIIFSPNQEPIIRVGDQTTPISKVVQLIDRQETGSTTRELF